MKNNCIQQMDAPYLSHSFLSLFVLFSKYVFGPGYFECLFWVGDFESYHAY